MIHLVPDEQPRLGIDAAKETANRAYTRARAAQSGPDVAALLAGHRLSAATTDVVKARSQIATRAALTALADLLRGQA